MFPNADATRGFFKRLWARARPTRDFFQKWMPTNILLLRVLRTRRGLKWGIPAMLIGAAYMFLAAMTTVLIGRGWAEALYLLTLLFIWNGLKFIVNGPISVVLLLRARATEHMARRRSTAEVSA